MKQYKIIQQTVVGILTILLLSCFIQSVAAQGNLVVNGGFDTDASNWTITNDDAGGYTSDFGNPPGSVSMFSSGPTNAPTVSQEINSLSPGSLYDVSGNYMRGSVSGVTDNGFGVALDGIYLFETTAPMNYTWYSFSFDYTATSTSTLLSLSTLIGEKGSGYTIDNIAMDAVPEPSAISLVFLGSGVLIYVRNRYKRH